MSASVNLRAMCVAVCVAGLLLLSVISSVQAAKSILSFDTPAQEALYNQLLQEYRCLKCQNQNLADSAASLAADLRNEIYERVMDGKSREDIDTYLVARYGDFVLYRPPFKATTWLLWIGPFVLLAIALFYAIRLGRRGNKVAIAPAEEKLAEARRLLDE